MKTIIIGSDVIDKLEYANAIIALNDNLNICRYFTSESSFDGMIGEYKFSMSVDDIDLSFKNDALLFIDYRDEYITGIIHEDFENSDIVYMPIKYFNLIPDFLLENDILIVWIDNKSKNNVIDLSEANYFIERIEEMQIPLLYFINDTKELVSKVVIEYLEGDEISRKKLLEEYN